MATIERDQLVSMVYSGHKKMTGLDLSGMDLSNLNLEGVDFTNTKLVGTNFTGANVKGCNFSRANAAHANFRDADLSGTLFAQTHLTRAGFAGAKTKNTQMLGCDLHETAIPKDVAAGVSSWLASWFPNRKAAGDADIPSKPLTRPKEGADRDKEAQRALTEIRSQRIASGARPRFSTLSSRF